MKPRPLRWLRRRPLNYGDRVALCVQEIRDAGTLTRAQRDVIVARWSLEGNVHDWADLRLSVCTRLGDAWRAQP